MYYNFTVQIPSIKGKVLTKDKGTTTYILYQYGLDYKPDKKYAFRKQRMTERKIRIILTCILFIDNQVRYQIHQQAAVFWKPPLQQLWEFPASITVSKTFQALFWG